MSLPLITRFSVEDLTKVSQSLRPDTDLAPESLEKEPFLSAHAPLAWIYQDADAIHANHAILGFAAVEAAVQEKRPLLATVFSSSEIPTLAAAYRLGLAFTMNHRAFSPIETGRAIFCAHTILKISAEEILNSWLPLFGFHPNETLFLQALAAGGLELGWRRLLHLKRAPLRLGAEIAQFAAEDRAHLLSFAEEKRFSAGVLGEITEHLSLYVHGKSTPSPIVLSDLIADLHTFSEEEIRTRLSALSKPHLQEMETTFRNAVASLDLPGSISLKPPPQFEGERFQAQFSFGSKAELLRLAERLREVASREELQTILSLL